MDIIVIVQRRELKISNNSGVKKFVMRPNLYIPIQEKKVFSEASTLPGASFGCTNIIDIYQEIKQPNC